MPRRALARMHHRYLKYTVRLVYLSIAARIPRSSLEELGPGVVAKATLSLIFETQLA